MIRYIAPSLVLVFILVLSIDSCAQLSTTNKKAIELYTEADNYRVRGQFPQAMDLLTQAIKKDKNFVEAYYRMALVYMSMRDFPNAISFFEKGLSLTSEPRKQKVFWYDLGESYMLTGQYEKAVETLKKYISVENQNRMKSDRAAKLLRNAEFALQSRNETSGYRSKALSDTVNCFALQYFPVLTADQQELIFTRRLGNRDEHDEDLVISRKNNRGQWTTPVSISKNINSYLNEGTCTISADGRKLIFTSCVGRQGLGSCDLFESVKIGDAWTTPVNLGPAVNSGDWESQPSLSADGRTLYFISERRGGLGRRDIWYSTLDEDGQWTKARNLGAPINTEFDEISPFIHVNDKILYFASNGLTGYGGYDLFSSERTADGWSKPENIGAPINNHEDQFSLFITADGKRGYYSHEEVNAQHQVQGKLYEIDIPEDKQIKFKSNYVKGTITDQVTGRPLKATVELFDIRETKIVSQVSSDSVSGTYLMVLTQGSEYALYINKSAYLFQSLNFDYSEARDLEPIIRDVALIPVKKGSVAVLKNIFFDVDKYDLQEKSQTELNKMIRFLGDNPQVRIEISGHTDNTGNSTYNQQLSEKRARSVYDYLVSHGVESKRLTWKGYGQSQPVDSNENEAGRQNNRRIEFRIL
jgi:OOP family OmpA-OmpF porin